MTRNWRVQASTSLWRRLADPQLARISLFTGLGKPARFAPHIAPGGPRVRRTVCLLAPMRVRVEAMTDAVTVRAVARARSGFDTCRVVR